MLYSWKDILELEMENFKLIWYGSLLNKNTYNYEITDLKPVVVKWFRRIYNLKMIPEKYSDEWIDNYKKYLKKYWVDSDDDIDNLKKRIYVF